MCVTVWAHMNTYEYDTFAIRCTILRIAMEVSESCKQEKKPGRKYRSESNGMKYKVTALWHLGTKMLWMF